MRKTPTTFVRAAIMLGGASALLLAPLSAMGASEETRTYERHEFQTGTVVTTTTVPMRQEHSVEEHTQYESKSGTGGVQKRSSREESRVIEQTAPPPPPSVRHERTIEEHTDEDSD